MIMIPSNVIDTVGRSATCIVDKNERERERDYTSSLQSILFHFSFDRSYEFLEVRSVFRLIHSKIIILS